MKNTKKKNGAAAKGKGRATLSAQQTIPYLSMHPDGVCKLPGGLYTKTVEYEDINYSVASTEDQTAIFSGWSSFLNYFDIYSKKGWCLFYEHKKTTYISSRKCIACGVGSWV